MILTTCFFFFVKCTLKLPKISHGQADKGALMFAVKKNFLISSTSSLWKCYPADENNGFQVSESQG